MSLSQLIESSFQQGMELCLSDGQLHYHGPKGMLTPELKNELGQYKATILSSLRGHSDKSIAFYPLSSAQKTLWFLYQVAPNSSAYNIKFSARILSNIDIAAFQRAFQALIDRHPSLRTTYTTLDEIPVQLVHEDLQVPFEVIDASAWSEEDVHERMLEEADRPFDLERGPLFRVYLFSRSSEEHILWLLIHHIAVDFYSFETLIEELGGLYASEQTGDPTTLPPLELQYKDYVRWETQMLASPEGEGHWAYLQKQLSGELPVLNLSTDRPRPPVQTYNTSSFSSPLPAELIQQLKVMAQSEGISFYTTLVSAFFVLLHRYTSQKDILLGASQFEESCTKFKGVAGYFVNEIPLRADLSENLPFREFLHKMHKTVQVAFEHQDYPSHLLAKRLHVSRDLSRPPLFQTIFMLQELHQRRDIAPFLLGQEGGRIEVDGLKMESMRLEERVMIFVDFQLTIVEEYGSFSAFWQYNTDLFDTATIERMAEHFQILLEGSIAHPDQRISDIPILSEAERHQILIKWNDTKADYPKDKCLHELFEAQVERTPDAVAVVFPTNLRLRSKQVRVKLDEETQIVYRELNQRANQLAHYLRALGVGPEVPVGIYIERSLEMIIGILGVLKAGGTYVPLDPAYPKERLSFMIADTQVPVLLSQEKLLKKLPEHQAHVVCLDSHWERIAQEKKENLPRISSPSNLAYILYTSGSTGRPKGVAIEHASPVVLVNWAQDVFDPDELAGVLASTSICFDLSVFEIFVPLSCGGKIVLAENALHLPILPASRDVTLINTVPSAITELLRINGIPDEVRIVNLAGEPLQNQIVQQIYQQHPVNKVFNLYGPSEDTTYSTFALIEKGATTSPLIGRSLANTQIYILDQQLQPVPIGVPGELYIGGEGLARDYLHRPELTAERFIPNPFSDEPDMRLYKTGDLTRYLPDGNIDYLGRLDHQVKIRGFRIELGEIEAVLTGHSEIREAVVLAREDMPGYKQLVAYVVPNVIPDRLPYQSDCLAEIDRNRVKLRTEDISFEGVSLVGIPTTFSEGKHLRLRLLLPSDSEERWLNGRITWCRGDRAGIQFKLSPTEQASLQKGVEFLFEKQGFLKLLRRTVGANLRNYMKQKLPDYMIPPNLVFLNSFPLTPNGKVNRRALPPPERIRPELEEGYVKPRTPVEKALVDIWCQILALERVGIHDNFFELGGDSLTITRLTSRVRSNFRVEVPIARLFEVATIADLAEIIETSLIKAGIQTIPRRTGTDPAPLSFVQQRLWFIEQLDEGTPTYNIPFNAHLKGLLNPSILEQSINEIVRRHEGLRTSFTIVNGEPVHSIAPTLTVTLPVKDLREFPEDERKVKAQQLALEDVQELFDLTQCPLFRMTLLQVDEEEYIFLMTIHHIIYDGWSVGVFMEELTTLYKALSSGKPSPLPELSIQYTDFAQWQREWMRAEVLERQLSYWTHQLSGSLPVVELPTDRPRPTKQTFQGEIQSFALSKNLSETIKSLSRQENVTPFMTLLAAFKLLLYYYTGEEDIIVGSPIANRNRTEIEKLIGFFVNTLALRTDLSGNPTFSELLGRVRKMTLEAHVHQDMPFDLLVADLHPERELNRQPLFQQMFVLQDTPIQTLEFAGVVLEPIEIHNGTSMFDLTLEMVDTERGLSGFFEYNTDLFDDSTITRMLEHFKTLLEGIVVNPEQRLSELSILTEVEQHKILVEWNDTEADFPKNSCIHTLFETQVEQTPDAVAVAFNGNQMTYRELNQRANQLAHYLQKLSVGPETFVVICMERSLEMLVGILGTLKAGAAYAPMDPANPTKRLAFMLKDTGAPVLITQKHLQRNFPDHNGHIVCLDSDWKNMVEENDENPRCNVAAENLAYVIYTSGSTGLPKGVLISHRALVNRCVTAAEYYALEPHDRILQFASISFDVSLEEIFPSLINGATVVLSPKEVSTSLEALSTLLEREKLTVLNLPTAYWHEWVSELSRSNSQPPSTLRLVIVGTEQASAKHLATWQSLVNDRVRWINAYGPTEATITATVYDGSQMQMHKESMSAQSIPIGRPINNTRIYLLDKYLQPVPIGVPGELCIGGTSLARGYLHQPGLTHEKFIPNPFNNEPRARLYKTGDLARYWPDGNIEFLGRIDQQVKIRGFRIELGEIEVVLNGYPAIQEVVIVTRDNGSGNKQLAAYAVFHQEFKATVNELRNFMKEQLPEYMIPATFTFLDALPMTSSGKVDRRALPEPGTDRPELTETFVAPRNPSEKVMVDIWAEILGLERIGVYDNFFDVGGHSLLSMQLVSQVEKMFQIEVPLQNFFETPTVAGLIEIIEAARQRGSSTTMLDPSATDFDAETALDKTICAETEIDIHQVTDPSAVFLTGATGFLGAFLLYDLLLQTRADIYCLVRSSDVETGRKRLQNTLQSYSLWHESLSSRVIPIPGDLSQPFLGLSTEQFEAIARKIDAIYHNGAMVNFVYPYSTLKAPNVLGTQEILKLASHIYVKPVHYISTLSVFDSVSYAEKETIFEHDPLDSIEGILDGYSQSKWVAEKLVTIAHSRGIPVCIYRPGRISGHSQTGVWNTDDFVCRMIKGCIQLGSVPHQDVMMDLTPVNYVSSAIAYLSQQQDSLGKAFHLINPYSAHWNDFVNLIRSFNYPLRRLSYDQWQAELIQRTINEDHALSPLLPLFLGPNLQEEEVEPQRFNCRNTSTSLKDTSIECPPVDAALLHTYFSYFIRSHFLEPPQLKD